MAEDRQVWPEISSVGDGTPETEVEGLQRQLAESKARVAFLVGELDASTAKLNAAVELLVRLCRYIGNK
ncbi:MAG: hypothetical protein E6R04_07225 [Spirochaetes bacterium]|nr:MAG: hypothetical protein E6R04_07225 [Spirochaetota bacterium]